MRATESAWRFGRSAGSRRSRWLVLSSVAASAVLACGKNPTGGVDAGPSNVPVDVAPVEASVLAVATPPVATVAPARPTTEICYTRAELLDQLHHPRGQVIQPPVCKGAACNAYFKKNGCLEAEFVRTSCCNPALGGPRVTAGKCCYTHQTDTCC